MNPRHNAIRAFVSAVASVAAVVLLLVGFATPAHAAASLINSFPVAGARVTVLPELVTLGFSEPIDWRTSSIEMYDPTGMAMNESPFVPSPDGLTLGMVNHLTSRPIGTYTVAWTAHSMAGEDSAGSFDFEYVGPDSGGGTTPVAPDPAPAPEVTIATATPSPTLTRTPSPTATKEPRNVIATPPTDSGSVNQLIVIIGFVALGLGVLAAIAVLIYFLLRRGKKPPQGGAPPDTTAGQ